MSRHFLVTVIIKYRSFLVIVETGFANIIFSWQTRTDIKQSRIQINVEKGKINPILFTAN